MPTTALNVSYALSPPEGAQTPQSLGEKSTHAFVIEAEKTSGTKEYYDALRKSIAAAREKLGEELTAWRDAVGNAEVGKERAAKAARTEEDEEDEEENLN